MRELPSYAYLPGSGMPHPTRHPKGHSYGKEEAVSEEDWDYGLLLFRAGYYWEAHEAWEGLWHEAKRPATSAAPDEAKRLAAEELEEQRLRGMIQLAAALLKHKCGQSRGAASLWAKSRAKLGIKPEAWRGLELVELLDRYQQFWLQVPTSSSPPDLPLSPAAQ